jgi:energy-converting hydrogenase A subunit M
MTEAIDIELDERQIIKKKYRIRTTGKNNASLETTIPREVFEREARRLGLSFEEAIERLVCVWRFNSFKGLHLSFEPASEQH